MAKLILSMDGLVLKEFHLDKPRITIGRRSTNDIQINNLAISGEHAVIVTILNDSFLEDLHSTNGTQVNGRAVKKRVLHHNDEIGFGKYKIRYLVEDSPAEHRAKEGMVEMKDAITSDIGTATHLGSGSNPIGLTATNTTPDHQATFVDPAAAIQHEVDAHPPEIPIPSPDNATHAVLRILTGSNRGKELRLTKEYALLGKNGGSVAAVTRELNCYYLSYVEGDKRPLVNRHPLGETPHRLNNGDDIEIAGVHMIFLLKF